jgi:hypothetical protein
MTDPVKIYCETSALEGNARQDTAEARESEGGHPRR